MPQVVAERGRRLGGLVVAAAMLTGLACCPAALGAGVTGMGQPFATAQFGCSSDPQARLPSEPVAGDHPDSMLRVTLAGLPDGEDYFWSVDLPEDPFIRDVIEWGGADGDRWWWPGGSVSEGSTLGVPGAECSAGDPAPSGTAEWFDRPTTPFEFSDPTVYHGQNYNASILGFVAARAGDYVADVMVRDARLEVLNPDYEIGDGAQNGEGTWRVAYEPPPGHAMTARLDLGQLEAGVHDLPYVFYGPASRDFSIGVRLRDAPASSGGDPGPSPPQVPAVVPPPSPPPGTAVVVAGIHVGKPAADLSTRRADSLVRSVLDRRLRGWRLTSVRCERTGPRRANCRFTARRGRARLSGRGTIARPVAGGPLRYRLSATVIAVGCRRADGGRCIRTRAWASRPGP